MPGPYFSIIIPTLNEEIYLPRLLKDVQNQTLKNFEVTIVDARSKDKTLQKASRFQNLLPHLNLIQSQKQNVSFQRNLGAKHSRGKWLIFFDADNKIPKDFLSKLKRKLEKKPTDTFTT